MDRPGNDMSRRALLTSGIGAFVTVLIAGCANTGAAKTSGPASTSKPSNALDLTYENFERQTVALVDHLGKPLVVNFFASWCAPCVTEMPEFDEVFRSVGQRINFLGLAVNDPISESQRLVEKTGISYPVGRDTQGELLAFFGGKAMPTTAFLDANGNLRLVQSRSYKAAELQAKLNEIFP